LSNDSDTFCKFLFSIALDETSYKTYINGVCGESKLKFLLLAKVWLVISVVSEKIFSKAHAFLLCFELLLRIQNTNYRNYWVIRWLILDEDFPSLIVADDRSFPC